MIEVTPFLKFKEKPLVVITAYDACFASIAEQANVDAILVGDSLANVILGREKTNEVDMDTMCLFVKAVTCSTFHTHIIADMPSGSYSTPKDAVLNAKRFKQLGAHAVKIEGCLPEVVKAMVEAEIPVMGHLGLLPQTATSLKQVGSHEKEGLKIIEEAKSLEQAGIYSLVLEHLNFNVAQQITQSLSIPTIGIGAGSHTNGQVLVLHDVLGLNGSPLPPFAKAFAKVREASLKGIKGYASAVRDQSFP